MPTESHPTESEHEDSDVPEQVGMYIGPDFLGQPHRL